ncbi:capsular polysaccharide biosynthesis protein [Salmonella enterica subsp. enterica serovar Choleraesuis]|nr:capsular polysaccharide biosynthesis protein [Salmonella enterica subsp. enterica serovar Choleraesuis]
MILKSKSLALIPLLAALLAGCSAPPQTVRAQPDAVYLLDAGDEVNITVSGEQDISMRFKIDSSGSITYPYIGQLNLRDKTPEQVSQEIANKLRGNYLQAPMVTVSIAEFRKIYLLGEVKKPDGYAWEPGLTAEKAIALAGGFTDRADRHDISIRLAHTGKLLENVTPDSAIQAGDTVIVGMSFF